METSSAAPQSALDSTLTLLERAREGDRAALERIAGRYLPELTRFAHGRLPAAARGMGDTGDLVQVAVVRMLGQIGRFKPGFRGSLGAYLRCIVLNLIRDAIRRLHRRPVTETLSPDLPAPDADPLQGMIRNENLERYEAALAGLPGDWRTAFVMRFEMGMSYREIAEDLGRPSEDAARKLVQRALKDMVARVRRSGG